MASEMILVGVLDLELALAAMVIVLGATIQGYSGFGSALFIMPLLSLLYGPIEAMAVAGIAAVVAVGQLSWAVRAQASWSELRPVLIGSVIAIPVGTYFLFAVDPSIVRRVIGGCVLATTILIVSGWVYRGSRGAMAGTAIGGVSGIVSGISTAGIPVIAAYFMAADAPARVLRANILIAAASHIFLVTAIIAINGAMGADTLARGVLLIAPFLLGSWAGSRLFAIAPSAIYRRVAIGLLITASLAALLS